MYARLKPGKEALKGAQNHQNKPLIQVVVVAMYPPQSPGLGPQYRVIDIALGSLFFLKLSIEKSLSSGTLKKFLRSYHWLSILMAIPFDADYGFVSNRCNLISLINISQVHGCPLSPMQGRTPNGGVLHRHAVRARVWMLQRILPARYASSYMHTYVRRLDCYYMDSSTSHVGFKVSKYN